MQVGPKLKTDFLSEENVAICIIKLLAAYFYLTMAKIVKNYFEQLEYHKRVTYSY